MPMQQTRTSDQTSYSFRFKCIAALTAGAVIALAVMIAQASSSSAATNTLAVTAVAGAASGFAIPIIALLLIGGICLLPFMFSPRTTAYVTTDSSTSYRRNGLFGWGGGGDVVLMSGGGVGGGFISRTQVHAGVHVPTAAVVTRGIPSASAYHGGDVAHVQGYSVARSVSGHPGNGGADGGSVHRAFVR